MIKTPAVEVVVETPVVERVIETPVVETPTVEVDAPIEEPAAEIELKVEAEAAIEKTHISIEEPAVDRTMVEETVKTEFKETTVSTVEIVDIISEKPGIKLPSIDGETQEFNLSDVNLGLSKPKTDLPSSDDWVDLKSSEIPSSPKIKSPFSLPKFVKSLGKGITKAW